MSPSPSDSTEANKNFYEISLFKLKLWISWRLERVHSRERERVIMCFVHYYYFHSFLSKFCNNVSSFSNKFVRFCRWKITNVTFHATFLHVANEHTAYTRIKKINLRIKLFGCQLHLHCKIFISFHVIVIVVAFFANFLFNRINSLFNGNDAQMKMKYDRSLSLQGSMDLMAPVSPDAGTHIKLMQFNFCKCQKFDWISIALRFYIHDPNDLT